MKTWEHHEYHVPHIEPWVPPLPVPPRIEQEPDPEVEAAVRRSRAAKSAPISAPKKTHLKTEKILSGGRANAEENKKGSRRRKPVVV